MKECNKRFEVVWTFGGMSGKWLTNKVNGSDVEGGGDSGRLCTSWLNGVREESSARSLDLKDAKVKYMD